MTDARPTLVVGAGYVGAAVARELAGRGAPVLALRRRSEPLGPGIEVLAADVTKPLALPPVAQIVYAVAPDGPSEAEYERAYVDGISRVLDAAPGARVVLTSSTAVYAEAEGGLVDESSPVSAEGKARLLLEGERRVTSAGGVALRLAGIYGPGRDRIVRMVREGSARIVPGAIGNRVHQRDCAGAILHLLALPRPAPVYVGVDDAPVELAEVYRFLAERLGVAEPPLGESDARTRGTTKKRCSNGLLRASGYSLRVPSYREGYGEMIDALLGR